MYKSLAPALTEDLNFSQRFYRGARNLALLDCTNIFQAIDFFVMEYVDGRALSVQCLLGLV